MDENYQNQENKIDNELQNLIKYHLTQNNLSLDTIHSFLE